MITNVGVRCPLSKGSLPNHKEVKQGVTIISYIDGSSPVPLQVMFTYVQLLWYYSIKNRLEGNMCMFVSLNDWNIPKVH